MWAPSMGLVSKAGLKLHNKKIKMEFLRTVEIGSGAEGGQRLRGKGCV